MTDLEADVDDVDEEKWDDGSIEKASDMNDVQMGEANGTHLEPPPFRNGAEEHPARTSSRVLTVQNGQGPFPSMSYFCLVFLIVYRSSRWLDCPFESRISTKCLSHKYPIFYG